MNARSTRYLVLGSSGPIGRAIERAAANGWVSVVGASRRGQVCVDVFDVPAVRGLLADYEPSVVIDLVDRSRYADERNSDHIAENVRTVADVCAAAGVQRIVQASSAAVYGDGGFAPYTEDGPLLGDSHYAMVKKQAEVELAAISSDLGISSVSLRIFNVFGDGCRNSLINRLIAGQVPRLLMSPGFIRDYVHVDDVARAILAAAGATHVTGAINVASGVPTSNMALAAASTGRFEYAPIESDLISYSVGATASATERLGWTVERQVIDVLHAMEA